ncbi:Sac2 family-domain-containing protein [Pilobolus umbonatus]|nr:Sac2 family-domain-containing protein [Pilobolus umbonatus]
MSLFDKSLPPSPPLPNKELPLVEDIKEKNLLEILDTLHLEEEEDDSVDSDVDFDDDIIGDDIVTQALENEMDLREYAHQIANEKSAVQRTLENNYLQHVASFINLHNEIESCDEVLRRMEDLLNVFQTDLGDISGEIQSLQEQSTHMSVKLKNRKVVETRLGKALQGMVIPPYMIKKIMEGEVDEVWLQYLQAIHKQMRFVKANQNRPIKALKNVGPELEKLRLKASSTIRDFFMSRIQLLSVPNANVQIMQQSVFLKYKELYFFLLERHHQAAKDVKQAYMNAMKWYFHSHFERYSKGLLKLQTPVVDKTDLIGVEEHSRKGGLFSKSIIKDKSNIFTLGDRSDTLRIQDPGVILIHFAESREQKYQFEQLFRSFNLTLIDNASSEYLFINEFFSRDIKQAADIAKIIFQFIFESTEKVGMNFTKSYVDHSYDAVGILLCIRINTQLALELQRRRVPTLEGYTNATNMLLWPRFQHVMSLHIESLKKIFNNKTAISTVKDIHPHYITRRYAEFIASLLVLNDGYDDAILIKSVHKLRAEFEAVLSRMSHEFTDSPRRIAFLINNYDLIVSVFQETRNKALDGELDYTKQLLSLQTNAFVDEELRPYFGSIMECKSDTTIPELERACNHFKETWRQSLTAINASVIQYFSNFRNGTIVLHAVLGQLIIYYTQFLDIIEAQNLSRIQPVNVQTVMVEIKKFRSNF